MVKLARPFAFFALLAIFSLVAGCQSTTSRIAGDHEPVSHPMLFSPSKSPAQVQKLWSQKIIGWMTDVNLSEQGNAVLVATQPDHDNATGGYAIADVNGHKGGIRWRHDTKGQVKAQSVSADGKLVVISNYEDELIGYNAEGRHLWTSEAVCKPIVLNAPKRILCFHDDDAEPDVAFDVFDFEGKKLSAFPIQSDILLLKVSQDQEHFVAAFAGGGVTLFETKKFKPLWQKKVAGEIADIALSSGANPFVAALYKQEKSKTAAQTQTQKIQVFDSQGKSIGQVSPSRYAEQIELTPRGEGVAAYGNSPKGQGILFYSLPGLKDAWSRVDPRFADYSSQMVVTDDAILVGFEDVLENTRHSDLLVFDFDGGLKAQIPLQTDEGAYIYAQGYSPSASMIAVGTDDGNLAAYRVQGQGITPR